MYLNKQLCQGRVFEHMVVSGTCILAQGGVRDIYLNTVLSGTCIWTHGGVRDMYLNRHVFEHSVVKDMYKKRL